MDASRFDSLTKRLADGRSRRSVLRGIVGGGAAAVATSSIVSAQDSTPEATPAVIDGPSWLVVLNFRSATAADVENVPGHVVYTLKDVDTDALAFTDRPQRETAEWSVSDLTTAIEDAQASGSPLNATFSARLPESEEKARIVVVLMKAEADSEAGTLSIQAVPFGGDIDGTPIESSSPLPTKLRGGYLFVDNVSSTGDSSDPCVGKKDGTTCSYSSCLAMYCECENGTCDPVCTANGDQCWVDTDCCNHYCVANVCTNPKPDGSGCSNSLECADLSCGCETINGNTNCCCGCL